MRFIRKNGRIIPIRERKDKALEAAGAAAGGAAAVYGLGKVAKRLSEATTRTEKVAKTQEKVVSKAARLFQKNVKMGITHSSMAAVFTKRAAHRIERSERLALKAEKLRFGKLASKRAAFILGGLALGHAVKTGVEAILGRRSKEGEALASHAVGFSTAAVGSAALLQSTGSPAKRLSLALKAINKVF